MGVGLRVQFVLLVLFLHLSSMVRLRFLPHYILPESVGYLTRRRPKNSIVTNWKNTRTLTTPCYPVLGTKARFGILTRVPSQNSPGRCGLFSKLCISLSECSKRLNCWCSCKANQNQKKQKTKELPEGSKVVGPFWLYTILGHLIFWGVSKWDLNFGNYPCMAKASDHDIILEPPVSCRGRNNLITGLPSRILSNFSIPRELYFFLHAAHTKFTL